MIKCFLFGVVMSKFQQNMEIKPLLKRIALCIVCCFPVLLVVGLLLEGKIASGWIIAIYVATMLVVIIVEELIYTLRKQKVQENKPKKDVFK